MEENLLKQIQEAKQLIIEARSLGFPNMSSFEEHFKFINFISEDIKLRNEYLKTVLNTFKRGL